MVQEIKEEIQQEKTIEPVEIENIMDTITIKDLVENVEAMNFEDIKFLLDGVKMNMDMAKYGS